jgi:glutamate carboxypeptidase
MALVLEGGGLNGEVVVGRKGNMSFMLEVQGRAGHAAFAGPNKASAIAELAHQCIAMEQLNDHQRGITVNVGKIGGGIGPNTVAENAWAAIDCRFLTLPDRKTLKKKLEGIAANPTVPGTRCRLALTSGRGPMEASRRNRDLFNKVNTVAQELAIPIKPEVRKGVSDANLIAHVAVPVLDGLGPIGDRDHSKDEYMLKASLHERCRLLAVSIAHLTLQPIEN